MYLDGGGPGLSSRPYAESTQAVIDREVSRMLREAEEKAIGLLRDHVAELDQLADLLIDQETVDGAEVYRLLGLVPPDHIEDAPTVAPHRIGAGQHATAPATAPVATAPPPENRARD
jgi:cell division protease FtsH